jgi:hypothetical protein
MVLKQGERAAIERVAKAAAAGARPAIQIADARRRIDTTNQLALKADITVTDALDARIDTAETNIISQAAVDVDHEGRIAAAETALPTKLEWAAVPASAAATGTAGQLAYEAGFLYVCVAADTWQRVAIATWP